jgi:GxxExxY protein
MLKDAFEWWLSAVQVNVVSGMCGELTLNELSERVIGAAIEVHRTIGPGLLESAYQRCLEAELRLRGIPFRSEVALPVRYKAIEFESAFRLDLIVADQLVVELKSVEGILPVHSAQLLTYLRLTSHKLGLLINFNVPVLWRGISRVVNHL